jgi:hypothetical protein
MGTLTTANSVIMLAVNGLYDTPVQLQGYSADDVFDLDEVDAAETSMGIDGLLSGGLIYVEKPWSISLQANSASNQVFDNWVQSQFAQDDIYTASMQVALPGLGFKWTYSNGILKKYPPAPSAGKILKPRKYTIVWNTISASGSSSVSISITL